MPESDGSPFSPFPTSSVPARRDRGDSPFPEDPHRSDDRLGALDIEDAPAQLGKVSRRALTAAGLAGVTLLAACQTLPRIPRALPKPTPTVTVPPTTTTTSLPTVTLPTTAPTTTSTTATTTTAATTTATTTAATTTAATTETTATTTTAPTTPVEQLPLPDLLARRASFGPTHALLGDITRLGVAAWLDEQLAPDSVPDPNGAAITAAWPDLERSYPDLTASKFEAWRLAGQLQARMIARAVWGSHQLHEVMSQFWDNHLHVSLRGDDDVLLPRPDYDTNVIRKFALGKFADMLTASGAHPSMMAYLNLAWSSKDNPNENYAREILELHTVGVDGGYTETDVKELAKLLTGWAMQADKNGWTPFFDPNRHFVGPVTVMGHTFANPTANGQGVLAEVAGHLARRPETAKYLAWKLVRHFVADEPPATLVDQLAATYLASDTAIAPVMRQLFMSPEFAASSGAKVRRPLERFIATLRLFAPQLPADVVKGATDLLNQVPAQQPFEWPTPDGYPDVAAKWISAGTALDLFNVGSDFVRGRPESAGVLGVKQLLVSNPTTFDAVASAAGQIALLRDPTDVERTSVIDLLAKTKLAEPLVAGSNEQRQAAELAAALLLASPAHITR